MHSRDTRFVLLIESGEQQGTRVPLDEGTLLIGRRPECGLALNDGSVSGKHAELRMAGDQVELVDLGSTNGTRVGGHKVERAHLEPGDVVLFGNVRASLQDARAGVAGGAASTLLTPSSETSPAAESGALGKVSADKLTRAGAGARRTSLVLGLLLACGIGGGAYLAFLRLGPGRGATRARVAVASVPGNLLADGTFEDGPSADGAGEWSAAESAPVAFLRAGSFASTGEAGLGVALEGEAWSLARSREFTLPARRSLACAASLRVEGAALGRFGVELSSSSAAVPAFFAWAPARRAGAGFEPIELAFDVLGGYDRGRLVVAGLGPGGVALDDASVLERNALAHAVKFNEYEFAILGTPGSSAMLVRSGRALLTGFDLSAWTRTGLAGWAEAVLSAQAGPRGFTLAFAGAPREARLAFLAHRPDEGPAGSEGWVATTGPEGYAAHGEDFERAGVTSLLLGSGTELLRVGFASPVEVAGQLVEGALAFRVALGGLDACELQLAFNEERAGAAALGERAAELERKQDLGAALAAWTELLDRFPFERKLVARATEARARLIQDGLGQVDELRREMERARFFLLPELFRKGQERALELAHQYRGSEVQAEAEKTAAHCQMALTELSAGARSGTEQRLRGVLAALDPAQAPRLVEHLRDALAPATPTPPKD